MSRLLDEFKSRVWTDEEKIDALKVIKGQIEMTMAKATDHAQLLENATSNGHRESLIRIIEQMRYDVSELTEVEKFLSV